MDVLVKFHVICAGGETPYCCRGYCVEMLKKMSELANFTYEVHLVADGHYGSLEKVCKGASHLGPLLIGVHHF